MVKLKTNLKGEKKQTLTALEIASKTTRGAASQVPKPTEGILAPVFNSKNLKSSFAIFYSSKDNKTEIQLNEIRKLTDSFFFFFRETKIMDNKRSRVTNYTCFGEN